MSRMIHYLVLLTAWMLWQLPVGAQSPSKVPFQGIDQTWQNGADRRDSSVFSEAKYFIPSVLLDINYNYSFNAPIDNTVVGSTALARHNEVQLSALHVGGDFTYDHMRARVMLQFGTRTTLVPRNDYSSYRGQYDLASVYRYLSEAYAGYQFDVAYGLNVDAGLFLSYIGLNSYFQQENWEYQASYTSDNTPWFFNGIRIQFYPAKNLKIEPWIINGWQSYGKFNSMPGLGGSILWMSEDSNLKLITNNYYGTDAAGIPDRVRFHSDNSVLARYLHRPGSKGISQMAFSITGDIGFEKGGGVNGFSGSDPANPAQYFTSLMVYHRLWFGAKKYAWTVGGGFMENPGRYLVLLPSGQASPLPDPNNPSATAGQFPFSANPGDPFRAWDVSTNIDFMPNPGLTLRAEWVYREASVPYFAGHGGVTSQTGYATSPLDPSWRPDLVKSEAKVIVALLFRM
ncbi:MAG: porin [Cyclobacteriaceae bacterium]|nr:porin [Cyclobacteriaceae bacterium]